MTILERLPEIEDFRMTNKCHHKLSDILLIGLFTYLSNGEDFEDMVLFAENNYVFVKNIVPYLEVLHLTILLIVFSIILTLVFYEIY